MHSYVANGVVCHNTHHASADTWYDLAMSSGAVRKYGLSGTPMKDQDLADMRMIGATGPLIYEVAAEGLIDKGLAAEPKIVMIVDPGASGPELQWEYAYRTHPTTKEKTQYRKLLPYKAAYDQAIINGTHHNAAVLRAVQWLYNRGRRVLVICRRKAHWVTLAEMFEPVFPQFGAIWGATPTDDRDVMKTTFEGGEAAVLLATTVFDEGEDVPGIDAIVLAEGVKIRTNALQRIGRGMRKKEGENDVWIVDFVPMCHDRLAEHATERVEAYEREGYTVKLWPPADVSWPEPDATEFDEATLLPFEIWDEVPV